MRALLLEAVDRSRPRTWLLAGLVGVVGVLGGVFVHRMASAGGSRSAGVLVSNSTELGFAESPAPALRVLFVGNSFTAANSLPDMVRRLLAGHSERRVFTVQYDPAGSRLHDAAADPQLLELLHRVRWNVVVLQEQSQLPALPYWLQASTLPAVHDLDAVIRSDGARALLFETWGYEHGDLMNVPGDTFAAMQTRLHDGYGYLAQEESVPVAAVGDAWAQALREQPEAPLWTTDGKHPSLEGSYLAAVVIAAGLLQQSRSGPTADAIDGGYTAGLDPSTATWLRHVALRIAAQPSTAL
jgi:hypothetical protein